MSAHETQSFFTPDEFFCLSGQILSQTYNLAHVLLNRSHSDHVFIPIRNLQYLAIIERQAFWFVDSLAYAVRGDEGGRLITVSWHPILRDHDREGLQQNMDCRVMFYGQEMFEIQQRLCGEFYQAMLLVDQRYRDTQIPGVGAKILPLNPQA